MGLFWAYLWLNWDEMALTAVDMGKWGVVLKLLVMNDFELRWMVGNGGLEPSTFTV